MQAQDIDFLIIGAAKSATTWLQQSLQADPAVCMPDPELHYFSRFHDRGDDWYFSQFPEIQAGQLVGEKSNSYLDTPSAPQRVHDLLPHVRLIVQLRNPVERAYSDYCMLYRRGEVGRDIDSYLDAGTGSLGRFLVGGLYCAQLQAYLDLYPKDRLLVLFFEEMVSIPSLTKTDTLAVCFDAIPEGKPFHTFPGIAPKSDVLGPPRNRNGPAR